MRDVAQLAGVSTKTVSNVVTGAFAVRPATRERVEAAIRELDFVPNLSARELRNGRTGIIGVALPDLDTAYSAELLHLLVEAAHRRGFAVQIEETAARPERERELISRAQAHRVDGLILSPVRLEDTTVTELEHLPPVVVIGEVEQHAADSVSLDNRSAAERITAHLIARGASKIAVLGGTLDGTGLTTATSRVRLAGVIDALEAAGMRLDPRLTVAPDTWHTAAAAEAMERLLTRGHPFDAVVAFTDSLALAALSTLHAHGFRVPDDVQVTGFDNVELSRFTSPALTTVDFELPGIADAAVSLLVERIEGLHVEPRALVYPFSVVERASTTRP
jgi:DNA-binding LacI/PurR family transcriptional regulator